MKYVDGFVIPVKRGDKDAYVAMARDATELYRRLGATRIVECWSEDVPEGKVTDFRRSVQAESGEDIVFSWVEWPSKEARDAGNARMREEMKDMRMEDMPFDAKRMIFGGFATLLDTVLAPGGRS